MNRITTSTKENIESYINNSKTHKYEKKSTGNWMCVFSTWAGVTDVKIRGGS